MIRITAVATATALAAGAAPATTVNGDYTFTIVQQTRALQQNDSYFDSMILADGSVATIIRGGDSVRRPPDRIQIVAPDGNVREITAPPDTRFLPASVGGLSVNESGQIAVAALRVGSSDNDGERRRLLLIEPDDTIRTLIDSPRLQPAGVADDSLHTISDVKINQAGEIAVLGSYRDANGNNLVRVIKIDEASSGSPGFTVLDSQDPVGTPNRREVLPVGIAIDDSGTVAWTRQQGDQNLLVLSDGTTETVAIESSGLNQELYALGELTESGLLAVSAGGRRQIGTSDVTDAAIVDDFTQSFSISEPENGLDLNEYGQLIATVLSGSLVLDGETIVSDGDAVGGYSLFGNDIVTNRGQTINDLGQFVFDARGLADSELYNLTIRADPVGATVANAVQPLMTEGNVTSVAYELVNGLGLDAPIYVDPVVATVFDYLLTGGPLLTSLVIPAQDLGAEDGVFEILFGGFSRQVAFGETLDFTAFAGFETGIAAFTIAGIDPGAGVAPDSPFVVGLTHAGLGSVALQITGREVATVIPLPAGAWLLLAGLGMLAVRARG